MDVEDLPSSEYPDAPRLAVGAVVFKCDRVLLVLRGRPPASGEWAIPGGSVKLGESLQAAAEREVLEETGIVIAASTPVYTFDVVEYDDEGQVRFHYLIVDLNAEYRGGDLRAGDDALAARWVAADELAGLAVNKRTLVLLRDAFGFGPK